MIMNLSENMKDDKERQKDVGSIDITREKVLGLIKDTPNFQKNLESILDLLDNLTTGIKTFEADGFPETDDYVAFLDQTYDAASDVFEALKKQFMELPWAPESMEKLKTIIATAREAFQGVKEEMPEEYEEFDMTLIDLEVMVSDQLEMAGEHV